MEFYKNEAWLYDSFMKAIKKNYSKELEPVLNYLKSKRTLLELGGGTGNFSKILSNKGFDVVCSDNSSEMLNIARKKGLVCKQIDMRNFNLDKKVDVILSMFNTLMYNQNEKELESNIFSCKRNLNPGGILIIEISNPKKLMEIEKYSYSLEIEPNIYLTQIDIRRENNLFHYFVFSDILNKTSTIDSHKTIIFSEKTIKNIIKKYFSSIEILELGTHQYFIGKC